MQSFELLLQRFNIHFNQQYFPDSLPSLYDPAKYYLTLGGKRVRPVMCLMGNELFGDISADAFHTATAIELFHNFTLIHDDIMDKAPLRRGKPTLHVKYNEPTALLAGDVMVVKAYDQLIKIAPQYLQEIMPLFNKTAQEVCEGQQMDMDFENRLDVEWTEYVHMVTLKTSVLLAASLQMGAMLAGANIQNQVHLYAFGKNLGIAFQLQDDYLDAFGDPDKFGKQPGGDIKVNKKTFLLIKALEVAGADERSHLEQLLKNDAADKVEQVLDIYRRIKVDEWAKQQKNLFLTEAINNLKAVNVDDERKQPLLQLAGFLIQRDY